MTVLRGPCSPDGHVHPLVLDPLDVEADGGDRGHNLVEVELVLHRGKMPGMYGLRAKDENTRRRGAGVS